MKKNSNIQGIGKGLYAIPEVSMILQLPQANVHRWLKDYYEGQFAESRTWMKTLNNLRCYAASAAIRANTHLASEIEYQINAYFGIRNGITYW